jgi:hypothetical protein
MVARVTHAFGPYEVELLPLAGSGAGERGPPFVALADAAAWYPRPAAGLYVESALRAGLEAGVSTVLVDFARRPYVNSATLAALVKIAEFFRRHAGGGVDLAGLGGAGEEVVDMLGLRGRLLTHPDVASALAAVRARPRRA